MKNWRISSTPDRIEKKRLFAALFALLPASALLSVCCGSVPIGPAQVLRALLGLPCGKTEADIVLLARLPRTCGCVLAGTALAVSGAVIQSVLANPLAAPNIIGVNAGAGAAVTVCGALFPFAAELLPLFAFSGALLAVLLVLFIAEKTGASRMATVLAGVAVSGVFNALTDALITLAPDSLNSYSDFRIGGFSNFAVSRLSPAVWMILAALALLMTLTNELDVLALGSEAAASLGLKVKRYRALLLAVAAALAGAAVSMAGLIGFVGLIVPHIMRGLTGENAGTLIPACALGGAVTLTVCDVISRTLFSPYELPVGIILSLAGGPFFIWLLLRRKGGYARD